MSFRTRMRRAMPYLVAAALGFASAYVVVAVAVFPGGGNSDDVTVPSLTGLTVDDATRRLSKLGLRIAKGGSRPSAGAPAGSIIEQNPLGGTISHAGETVTVTTSAGQRQQPVPETKGMSRRDAEQALEDAGFSTGTVTQQPSDAPRGTVLQSDPAAGTNAALGPVALVISSGPAAVVLPNVVGRSYADARSALEQLGLVVSGSGLDSTSTAPAGTVVSMNPSAGRTVPSGSGVGLRLSAGIGIVNP